MDLTSLPPNFLPNQNLTPSSLSYALYTPPPPPQQPSMTHSTPMSEIVPVLRPSVNNLDSLVSFYQQERMWIYRTRVELQDAEDEDSPPPPNSPPSPSVSHEPPIRPSRRSSSPTRWTRRKKDLKLNPSSSRRSLRRAWMPRTILLYACSTCMNPSCSPAWRVASVLIDSFGTRTERMCLACQSVHTTQNVVPQITRVMSINSVAGCFLPFTCIIVIFLASTSSHIFKSLSLRHTRVIIPTYCFFLSAVTWHYICILHVLVARKPESVFFWNYVFMDLYMYMHSSWIWTRYGPLVRRLSR
ncbi:hypothetical protein CPB85DRAFT_143177 [Mucidula mucida]|nr:hypothetical protein CPB85DRAFT_143177 [Mucidula mucida]